MCFYIGAFQFVPLLAVMALVLVSSIVMALVGSVGGRFLDRTAAAHPSWPALVAAALVLLVEVALRARDRLRTARPLESLAELGRAPRVGAADVGAKAHTLVRLRRLGLRVPDGIVVTARACSGAPVAPDVVRTIARRLKSGAPALIVRSTFVGEDGVHSHAGVFETVRDVPAGDVAALGAAIERVRLSGRSPRAQAYRQIAAGPPPRAAVLVQPQIEGLRAVVGSRPFDGRADAIVVELEGCAQTLELDLVTRRAVDARTRAAVVLPDAEALLGGVLLIEAELGGPVQVEAVHDGDGWSFVQARPLPIAGRRRAYLCDGPIALDPEPRPPLVWSFRGGLDGIARSLAASLARAGLTRGAARLLQPDALRLVDGRLFVDAEALRAVETSAVGSRSSLRQLGFVLGTTAVGQGPAPARFATARAAADFAATLATWRDAQAACVARIALLDATRARLRQLDLGGALFDRWLSARLTRERAARDALRARLESAEAALLECADMSPLGRAARQLSLADFAAGAAPPADSVVDADAPAARVRHYAPPLPRGDAGTSDAVRQIVDKPFAGRLCVATEAHLARADEPSARIWIVPDGSPRWYPLLRHAAGLLLLRGGILSHLATLARERELPCALWPDPPDLTTLDGRFAACDAGRVRLRDEQR